uniref:Dickkopf WNT signaling pathway inhibitor 1 n=1 Tax=Catharus ustulatus TaxID=91951 RepID=A0A8C3TT16_CATUS
MERTPGKGGCPGGGSGEGHTGDRWSGPSADWRGNTAGMEERGHSGIEASAPLIRPSPLSPPQPFPCAEDEDCGPEEFCGGAARGGGAPLCLGCRRRRKRCLRDAMCCPGMTCSNGLCTPLEPPHGAAELEEPGTEALPRRTPAPAWLPTAKGQEGDICLRSSDCAAGLCCARHFWSKICKPVLREGQVCTRHRRKGAHGLEIFQRCPCAEGLACRLQREHGPADASRLHTCQRH